ncbi:MAG: MFS transporter [Gorillibacterium sp.]|nr:MFS transporter [Gorillibacterium sp.]
MSLFSNRTFLKLFLASFTSQLGTIVGNMAFAFYLLDHFSNQPSYATLAEMMYALPTLAVFFIVGVIADRVDRRRIAEYSDWVRAGLTLILFIAISMKVLPVVFFILFLRSAVSKFFQPAESSMLQGILSKEQYTQASGLNQMIFGVFMLFGVGLGAISYQYIGIQGAVMVDGFSFIISALLIHFCRISESVRLPNGKADWKNMKLSVLTRDFKAGLSYILQHHLLLMLISGFFIFGLINGAFAVLPLFTMKYKLAPDTYERFTTLFAIFLGIGFLIGSVIGTSIAKLVKPHQIMIAGLFAAAGVTMILGFINHVWLYLILFFVLGLFLAPVNIAIGGWKPAIVEPAYMGRVNAWIDPLMMLAHSIALGLIALVYPHFVGLSVIYYGIGIALFSVFLIYAITLPKLSRVDSQVQVQVQSQADSIV